MAILSCIGPFVNILFLSNALSFVMTYYWGRKSKNLFVNFMGIITMRAPYLPWFYLGLSLLLDSDFKVDLIGIVVGHFYFFIKDILPRIKSWKGLNLFKTPYILTWICEKLNFNNELGEVPDDFDMIF